VTAHGARPSGIFVARIRTGPRTPIPCKNCRFKFLSRAAYCSYLAAVFSYACALGRASTERMRPQPTDAAVFSINPDRVRRFTTPSIQLSTVTMAATASEDYWSSDVLILSAAPNRGLSAGSTEWRSPAHRESAARFPCPLLKKQSNLFSLRAQTRQPPVNFALVSHEAANLDRQQVAPVGLPNGFRDFKLRCGRISPHQATTGTFSTIARALICDREGESF
jgi:hypothetical protein